MTNEQSQGAEETPEVSEEKEQDVVKIPKAEYEDIKATIGSLKRELKDSKKGKEETPKKTKTDELDYGQLAYLKASGIADEDHDFIKDELKKFGGELKDLLSNEYFQQKLKGRIEERGARAATPQGNDKGNPGNYDTTEVAYAKWKSSNFDDAEFAKMDWELQGKMLDARLNEHKRGQKQFTDRPVVGNVGY